MVKAKAFVVLLLQLTQTALAAGTVIYLAQLLDADDYGQYVYYLTAVSVLPLFAGLGGEHVFLMQGSRARRLVPVLFGNAVATRITLTIASMLVVGAALYLRQVPDRTSIALILAGSLIAVFSNPLFLSLYRVQGIHVRPWLIVLCGPAFQIVYLVVLPSRLVTLQAVAIGFLLSHVLTLGIFLFDIGRLVKPRVSGAYFRRYFKPGVVFSLSQGFDYAFSRIDLLLIEFVLGPYSVGIYAAGQRVVTLFQVLPSSFHIVELPEFHRAAADPVRLETKFRRLRRLMVELSLLCFGLLILNSRLVVDVLFKPEYGAAVPIVALLAVAGIFVFVNYPYYMLAEAINRIDERLHRKIATFVFTGTLVFILLDRYGIAGAAVGLILGQALFVALLHQLTHDSNGGMRALVADSQSVPLAAGGLLLAYYLGTLMRPGIGHAVVVSVTYLIVVLGIGSQMGISEALRELRQVTSDLSRLWKPDALPVAGTSDKADSVAQ